MKILLINHYAGSLQHGMEYRPYYLAREWVRSGHAVCIVAASHSHVRSVQPELCERTHRESIDGVDYLWYRTSRYRGNGIARALNIASFCSQLMWNAKQLARDFQPDVVVASSTYPMDIWPAHRIARLASAKLVHEVHDLWPLSPMELNGMSARHPFIAICQAAEDFACRRADVVVSMLPKVHDHLAAHGLDLAKLHIVPNGVQTEEWDQAGEALAPELAQHIRQVRGEGRLVVVYAGAHGLANALDSLLDAAALLTKERFSFVLVGDGAERERLLRRLASEGLTQVRMFAPIPKRQISSLLAAADVAYIGLQRVPLFRFGIAPNKLMDYMMGGCVVLSAIEAGNDPVQEAGCGLSVSAESPTAIADGLRALAKIDVEARHAMGRRGREYVRRHYTWPTLAKRFVEALA
ncbi:glycosyltransferase family 4 protein [Variovorax sp. LjRoot290]|uniref:glycosyltransferase family 4 protein n=1 Tax=Variovorax sp. LjRoot290 TaxID=3342316 RepID=UPI003ED0AB12